MFRASASAARSLTGRTGALRCALRRFRAALGCGPRRVHRFNAGRVNEDPRMTAHTTRFYAAFAVLLALLVGVVAVGLVNFRRLAEANRWSVHTYAVLNDGQALQKALL